MKEELMMDKEEFGLEERAREVADYYFTKYATERLRLKRVEICQAIKNIPVRKASLIYIEGMILPVLHFDVQLLTSNGRLNTSGIKAAVKKIAALENKMLAMCDDGESFFEAHPLDVILFSRGPVQFIEIYEIMNSRKTPTMKELEAI